MIQLPHIKESFSYYEIEEKYNSGGYSAEQLLQHLFLAYQRLHQRYKEEVKEWAENHSHLQKLCLKAGYSDIDVYGDNYRTRTTIDLGNMLSSKIDELWRELFELKLNSIELNFSPEVNRVLESMKKYRESVKAFKEKEDIKWNLDLTKSESNVD